MKKLPSCSKMLVVLAIATVAVGVLSFLSSQNSQILAHPPLFVDCQVNCQDVTVSNGNYNISVVLHATQSLTIQRILINPSVEDEQAIEEVSGLTTYLNGTAVSMARPLSYHLRSGDYLQVNVIMPCTEAHQNQNDVTVLTSNPNGMYSLQLNLDQNPSGRT